MKPAHFIQQAGRGLAALFFFAVVLGHSGSAQQPNIILVMADDLGWKEK